MSRLRLGKESVMLKIFAYNKQDCVWERSYLPYIPICCDVLFLAKTELYVADSP